MLTLDEMKRKKKELGYSNQKIADLSGVSFGTVQKIFGGYTTTPRHETLVALDKILNRPHVVYSLDDIRSDSDIYVVREKTPYSTSPRKQDMPPQDDVYDLHTIDDYYALPDDQRMELIDGVFYDLAAPSNAHQIISGQLFLQFNDCIREHQSDCNVMYAPVDVQLDQDDFTMVQPDLLIFCGMENVRKNKYFGAPDFVAEILSPSESAKHINAKLTKYRESGVRECWFISPRKKKIAVFPFFREDSDDKECLIFPDQYSFDDQIPLGISDGKCTINFSKIHEAVKPFLSLEP